MLTNKNKEYEKNIFNNNKFELLNGNSSNSPSGRICNPMLHIIIRIYNPILSLLIFLFDIASHYNTTASD